MALLGIFAYLSGHMQCAQYLTIPYIAGAGEVAVFCAAIVGATRNSFRFNTYPAQVFMGDVGALGLGAALGIIRCSGPPRIGANDNGWHFRNGNRLLRLSCRSPHSN